MLVGRHSYLHGLVTFADPVVVLYRLKGEEVLSVFLLIHDFSFFFFLTAEYGELPENVIFKYAICLPHRMQTAAAILPMCQIF